MNYINHKFHEAKATRLSATASSSIITGLNVYLYHVTAALNNSRSNIDVNC